MINGQLDLSKQRDFSTSTPWLFSRLKHHSVAEVAFKLELRISVREDNVIFIAKNSKIAKNARGAKGSWMQLHLVERYSKETGFFTP